jgi:hypothetical protein
VSSRNDPDGVGYRRPPRHTRFKPGQSGNRKGRPKGSRNFGTVIQEELNARIVISENGRRKTISKKQAVAKQLVNKAATGDPRAMPVLLNENRIHEASAGRDASSDTSDAEDRLVMESILRRIRNADISIKAQQTSGEPDVPSNEDGSSHDLRSDDLRS